MNTQLPHPSGGMSLWGVCFLCSGFPLTIKLQVTLVIAGSVTQPLISTPYCYFSFQISHLHLNIYLKICLWGKLNQNTYLPGFFSWKNTHACETHGRQASTLRPYELQVPNRQNYFSSRDLTGHIQGFLKLFWHIFPRVLFLEATLKWPFLCFVPSEQQYDIYITPVFWTQSTLIMRFLLKDLYNFPILGLLREL